MPYKDPEKEKEYKRKWSKKRYESDEKYRAYRQKMVRDWYKRHSETAKYTSKIYQRNHCLRVNGKRLYGLNKRKWTGHCELCRKTIAQLDYHHWNDDKPEKGIWICFYYCHHLCEMIEKGIIPLVACQYIPLAKKYLELKQMIDEDFVLLNHPKFKKQIEEAYKDSLENKGISLNEMIAETKKELSLC